MEVLPCSRVAHIARVKKPYHNNIAFHTRRNALRVAEVWMDNYKSNVYLAWNIPMEVRVLSPGGRPSLRRVGAVCVLLTAVTLSESWDRHRRHLPKSGPEGKAAV